VKVDELLSRFEQTKLGATEAQIARLEKSLNAKLPNDYKAFLAICNGGKLDEQLEVSFRSDRYVDGYGNAIVERFFAIGSRGETAVRPVKKHLSEIGQLPENTPDHVICIADDYSGNAITLDLRSRSYGQIGLIDHELIGESFDDSEGYQVVSSSFSDFVAGLRDPSEYESIDPESGRHSWVPDGNVGLWVMLIGLAASLIVLAWLGEFS